MWIFIRLSLALIGVLIRLGHIRIQKFKFSSMGNGLRYLQYSRDIAGTVTTHIYLEAKTSFYFKLVQESRWTKLSRFMGLGLEVPTGDERFDRNIYCASDDPQFQALLQANYELREFILQLRNHGLKFIRSEGKGIIHIRVASQFLLDFNFYSENLKKLVNEVEKISAQHKFVDKYSKKILIYESVVYAMVGVFFGNLLNRSFGTDYTFFKNDEILILGTLLGGIFFLCWIFMALRFFKKSSRFPVVLSETSLILAVVCLLEGGRILKDINVAFDFSTPQYTWGKISEFYSLRSGSGKSATTKSYVRMRLEEGANLPINVFQVSSFYQKKPSAGKGARVTLRQGFLGYQYIEDVEVMSLPKDIKLELKRDVPNELKNYLEAYPSHLGQLKISKKTVIEEEKYSNGNVKSRLSILKGKRHGPETIFHENGRVQAEIPWENDLKDGCYKSYREDGTLEMDLCYSLGELHGPNSWYDINGKVIRQELYDYGTLVGKAI